MYFRTCEICGATLDPNEKCTDCAEQINTTVINQFKEKFEDDVKIYGTQTESRRKYVSI